jgi:hypothetical protein
MGGGRVGWFGACQVGGNHVSIVLIGNRHTSSGCSVLNDLVMLKLRVNMEEMRRRSEKLYPVEV